MFDIAEFLAQTNQSGFTKLQNFYCHISRTSNGDSAAERDMTFRCSAVNLPSRSILTIDHMIYGLPYQKAVGTDLDDCQVRIMLSEDLREKLYFEQWQDQMVGNYRTGSITTSMFNLGYYDTYANGTLTINVQNDIGDTTHTLQLLECYPTAMGLTENYAWSDPNQFNHLNVNFAYRYFIDEPTQG